MFPEFSIDLEISSSLESITMNSISEFDSLSFSSIDESKSSYNDFQ